MPSLETPEEISAYMFDDFDDDFKDDLEEVVGLVQFSVPSYHLLEPYPVCCRIKETEKTSPSRA